MILSSQAVSALLRATDKAIPEQGDSDLTVLSALILSIQPILPLDVLASTAATLENSFITEGQIDLVGVQPAGSQPICGLAPGLWTLDLATFDQMVGSAGTLEINAWRIDLDYQGYNQRVLSNARYSAALRLSENRRTVRLLLRTSAVLTLRWNPSLIGERTAMQYGVIATRHL